MIIKTLANVETDKSVPDFIDAISNKRRQADSRKLLSIMQEITGKEPKIWGVSIVGFGKYKYQRKNGDEYEWFNVGFSPGKAHLTVYVMYDLKEEEDLLNQLGPNKTGRGCLYIKRLEEVDEKVLRKIISKSDRWK
ncbi:DUF1801 domain-containing protein [Aureisphaera galaxeae]|uniref:DUF1801 domain-containing protein n=1 Tax=Aureisphaera galaxeae TaxID=1538023 RepID=UPI0023507515|nr:DUF1801 domain-containing protein [Aureisphaera galaxeae]MDC8005412.1 DUF1801 domain-containing protein [Aureisphaera galaxeae]